MNLHCTNQLLDTKCAVNLAIFVRKMCDPPLWMQLGAALCDPISLGLNCTACSGLFIS